MTISQQISALCNPQGEERISPGTFSYFETRNRFRIFSLILEEFERSGITKATLARRMGKGADQINRLLGSPGNLTEDTISNLLFAISGAEPTYSLTYPLEKAARNDLQPEWMTAGEKLPPAATDATSGIIEMKGTIQNSRPLSSNSSMSMPLTSFVERRSLEASLR